jgi:hypothetical protein
MARGPIHPSYCGSSHLVPTLLVRSHPQHVQLLHRVHPPDAAEWPTADTRCLLAYVTGDNSPISTFPLTVATAAFESRKRRCCTSKSRRHVSGSSVPMLGTFFSGRTHLRTRLRSLRIVPWETCRKDGRRFDVHSEIQRRFAKDMGEAGEFLTMWTSPCSSATVANLVVFTSRSLHMKGRAAGLCGPGRRSRLMNSHILPAYSLFDFGQPH